MSIALNCIKSEQALDMAVADLKSLHSALCQEATPSANLAAELLRRDLHTVAEAVTQLKQTLADIQRAFPG